LNKVVVSRLGGLLKLGPVLIQPSGIAASLREISKIAWVAFGIRPTYLREKEATLSSGSDGLLD
jgi:hypothetical protein